MILAFHWEKMGVVQWHYKWIMGANIVVRKPSPPPPTHSPPQLTTNDSKNMVHGRRRLPLLSCFLLGHSVILPVSYPGLELHFASQPSFTSLSLSVCHWGSSKNISATGLTWQVICHLLPSDKPINCPMWQQKRDPWFLAVHQCIICFKRLIIMI